MRRRFCAAAVATAALALTVAACSSSSSASGSGSAGASGAKEPSGSALMIGLVAPQGTSIVNDPLDIAGMNAAIRGFNARGGIEGHKLQLVYCNDEGDPNTAAACARQMISSKVIGVFGGESLVGGSVVSPMLAKAGIPQIGLTPTSLAEWNSPNAYLFGAGDNYSSYIFAALAASKHLPISIVYPDEPTAQSGIALIANVIKSSHGDLVSEVPVSPTQADFAPTVLKATSGGVKVVDLALGAAQAEAFVNAAQAAGQHPLYLSPYQWAKSDVPQLGGPSVLTNTLTAQQFEPLNASNAVTAEYLKDMAAEAATGDKGAVIGSPGGISSVIDPSWLAVWAVNQIATQEHLTNITSTTLTAALNNTKNLSMGGIMPPWTPNAAGPAGMSRAANTSFYLIGWKNEDPYVVTPNPVTVAQLAAGTVPVNWPSAG